MAVIAALALLKPDIAPLPSGIWIFLIFIAGFAVATFRAYRTARCAQLIAEERLRPKIRVSFGEGVPGCIVPTSITGTNIQAKWIRLRLEADCVGVVPNCSVTLIGLSRDNNTIFDGESIALNMARSISPPFDRKTYGIKFLNMLTCSGMSIASDGCRSGGPLARYGAHW
jgi:hypothetical protein